jgi:hypothetical protein
MAKEMDTTFDQLKIGTAFVMRANNRIYRKTSPTQSQHVGTGATVPTLPSATVTIDEPTDLLTLLIKAVDIIMLAPGGHQDVADGIMAAVNRLKGAIDEAGDALGGDSNDDEHDALVSIMEALGQKPPEEKD